MPGCFQLWSRTQLNCVLAMWPWARTWTFTICSPSPALSLRFNFYFCVCLYACAHLHGDAVRVQKNTLPCYRWLWAVQHDCWELNSGALDEQYLSLTSEPSFSPDIFISVKWDKCYSCSWDNSDYKIKWATWRIIFSTQTMLSRSWLVCGQCVLCSSTDVHKADHTPQGRSRKLFYDNTWWLAVNYNHCTIGY